jgi:hypothetical protein
MAGDEHRAFGLTTAGERLMMKIDWDEFERTRGEFKHGDEDHMERSDQEHPEQAYRRGVQQGAYFVLEALENADQVLWNCGSIHDFRPVDPKLLVRIRRYVGTALGNWRYAAPSRRLRRRYPLDEPPRMVGLDRQHLRPRRVCP